MRPFPEGAAFLDTLNTGRAIKVEANGRKPRSIYCNLYALAKRHGLQMRGEVYPTHVIAWVERKDVEAHT